MPRTRVETANALEHLSILDEKGGVDEELVPDLSDETLQGFYRAMLLARRFDDRMLSLQRQGRLGTFAPVRGQEACQVGSAAAAEPDDWVVPSYREIAVNVWRGLPLEGMLVFNAGWNEGGFIPEDHPDLPNAVPVGSQLLHAAGLAYGLRVQGSDRVVLSYFGDGATSTGDFHEALNFAGVFSCPVVFLCQNNQYAISVPRERQTRSKTLAQKAFAYDLPCLQVDGNDVLAVYAATREAVARAREEAVPTLLELVTYRLGVHTTVDDPSVYRDEEEVEAWKARDPLPRLRGYLEGKELLDDSRHETLEDEVEEAVQAAVDRWEEQVAGFAGPEVLFDHLLAERPAYLEEQREAFRKRAGGGDTASRKRSGDAGDESKEGDAGDESEEGGDGGASEGGQGTEGRGG